METFQKRVVGVFMDVFPDLQDPNEFFDLDDFAVVGTFKEDDEQFTQNVIFEEPTSVADFGNYQVTSTNPSILVKYTSAIAGLKREDKVAIANTGNYLVEVPPKHDGRGVARVWLINDESQDRQGDNNPFGNPFGG